jgi:chaperonin GroES
MKPLGDQLLLKARETQTKTKSGIILTANNDVYGYADVINAGPGLFTQTGDRIPMSIKTGDVVLAPVNKLSGKNGNQIKLDDETYVLV